MKQTIAKLLIMPALFLAGCEEDDNPASTPTETNAPTAAAATSGPIPPDPVDEPQPDGEFKSGDVIVGFHKDGTDGITLSEADAFFGAYGLQYEVTLPSSSDSNRIWMALASVQDGTEWQWVLTFRKRDIVDWAILNGSAGPGG